eukprot:7345428-Pyramimonas_sp.AAC.1
MRSANLSDLPTACKGPGSGPCTARSGQPCADICTAAHLHRRISGIAAANLQLVGVPVAPE